MPVCVAAGDQNLSSFKYKNGVFLSSWVDTRNGNDDIYSQLIDTLGNRLWPDSGVAVCTHAANQLATKVESDGADGWFFCWTDDRTGTQDIYAQRVISDGSLLWETEGRPICQTSFNKYLYNVVSDNRNGFECIWTEIRSSCNDVYVQRFDSLGNALWQYGGVKAYSLGMDQYNPSMISDGFQGAFIVFDFSGNDLMAQRVDSLGNTCWGGGGILIADNTNAGPGASICKCYPDRFALVWSDMRNATHDIYAQAVDMGGMTQWAVKGMPICTAQYDQIVPISIGDGHEGAIVVWRETPVWTNNNLYAQRIFSDGHVGVCGGEQQVFTSILGPNVELFPNPARKKLKISCDVRRNGLAWLQISNVIGQAVKKIDFGYRDRGILEYEVNIESLPAGIYLLTISTDSRIATKKFQVIR